MRNCPSFFTQSTHTREKHAARDICQRLSFQCIPVSFIAAVYDHKSRQRYVPNIDLDTGDVYIRQSKRHKDRHIIMSKDMLELCQRYDSVAGTRQWFFQKWDGTPYETSWYNQIWRNLTSKSGIPWKGTPRPYDLRHAFASRNIIRWLDSGRDVMELLPYLSAYMGHSELTSTLYYIHLLPEKLRKSKGINWDQLSSIYGKVVPEDED